jgi:hypothetical protein
MFDSHMPWRARAAPMPRHDHPVLKATSQGYGTARLPDFKTVGLMKVVS